jgi:hypothetical protein
MSPSGFTSVCPDHSVIHTSTSKHLSTTLIDGFKQTLTSTFHLWLKIMIQCASFMERHCAAIAVIWKLHGNNSVSPAQIFSSTIHISDLALPTLLNAVDLVDIVQKVGWWSGRFQESNERAARASSWLASTTQKVAQDWFYAWAGRFPWGWVMFLSN